MGLLEAVAELIQSSLQTKFPDAGISSVHVGQTCCHWEEGFELRVAGKQPLVCTLRKENAAELLIERVRMTFTDKLIKMVELFIEQKPPTVVEPPSQKAEKFIAWWDSGALDNANKLSDCFIACDPRG